MSAVFPKVNTLPGAKQQSAVRKRHGFTGPRERHFDMTGHVVRTFQRMLEVWIVFRNQPIKPSLEIGARGRVSIFHDDQAAARVLAENRHHTLLQAAVGQLLRNEFGDFVQALAMRANRMYCLMNGHEVSWTVAHEFLAPSGFHRSSHPYKKLGAGVFCITPALFHPQLDQKPNVLRYEPPAKSGRPRR